MKIISKVTIHPISYVITIIFFLMGYFRKYITFMIIIFIHELGHVITAICLKWKIEKIVILPFGCLIKFKEYINRPIKEEFIISIMGIIFQLLFSLKINIYYNIVIIIFNLIPIYPLDGSKILNLFFNKIGNFKFSFYLSIVISYFILLILLVQIFIKKDLISFLIIIPLLLEVIRNHKNIYCIYNKFYLERYLYNFKFKKIKIINNINKMKRDYAHIIKCKDKYLTENVFLRNMFDK